MQIKKSSILGRIVTAIASAIFATSAPVTAAEETGTDTSGEIEEIVVTGSHIKRKNQADLASPIDVVGLEDIAANGWSSIEDIAEILTFNTSSSGRTGLLSTCCGSERGIELRGLGSGSTLVLQNGKRVASNGQGSINDDMTNIKALMPVIAIDRVETLLDGAAAIYGSDAVAGVVNIIPRKNFEGFEMRAGSKNIEGSGHWEFQMIAGVQNDRVRGMAAIGFTHQDPLRNHERAFRLINNTSGNGSPGTYRLHERPLADDGVSDLVVNNSERVINYTQLWDQATDTSDLGADGRIASGPFAGQAPVTSLRVADPHCIPGIVEDFPGGRVMEWNADGSSPPTTGDLGAVVPGGGQFTPAFGGAPWGVGSCRYSFQPSNSITPEDDILVAYTNWGLDIAPGQDIELEYSMRWTEQAAEYTPSVPMTNGKPVVPASNPLNPFNQDVPWTGRPLGNAYRYSPVDARQEDDFQSHRFAVTYNLDFGQYLEGEMASTWGASVSGQYSWDRISERDRDTHLLRLQYALQGYGGTNCDVRFDGPGPGTAAGTGNCYYWSPFAADIYLDTFDSNSGHASAFRVDSDGNVVKATAAETYDVIEWFIADSESFNERELYVVEGIAAGDIFALPGGNAALAVGFQHRRDEFERFDTAFQESLNQGFLPPQRGGEGRRSVDAVFAELSMPLHDTLDVQFAVRREEYSQGLESTDPKVGIKWSPTDWLSLRGSYSTSFKAPSLRFAVGTDSEGWVEEIRDPLDPVEFYNNTGTFRTILVGKNPDLDPEESENFNFGASLLPELPWGDGNHSLQLDFDYFTFDFENRFQIKPSSQVVTADPCGPMVVRDTVNLIPDPLLENDPTGNCGSGPVGNVLIVKQSYQNSGGVKISGADFKAKYSFDIGETNVTIRSQTSMMLEYDIRNTPTSAVMDGVGWTNDGNAGSPVPKIRSNMFLNVNRGNHSLNTTVRYISKMKDDVFGDRSTTVPDIDAHTEVDLQYQYTFGDAEQYNIALGAVNLFDKEPPFHRFEGYVLRVHNPFMRQLYARVKISL